MGVSKGLSAMDFYKNNPLRKEKMKRIQGQGRGGMDVVSDTERKRKKQIRKRGRRAGTEGPMMGIDGLPVGMS